MSTNDYEPGRMPQVLGERFFVTAFEYFRLPKEYFGWMSVVLGLTREAKAHLANPELRLMIVEEPARRVTADDLQNFKIAKKQRPDVRFVVFVCSMDDDQELFRDAGAEYVVHRDDTPELLFGLLERLSGELSEKVS